MFAVLRAICRICVVSSCRPPVGKQVADDAPHTVLWRDLGTAAAAKGSQCTGACEQKKNSRERLSLTYKQKHIQSRREPELWAHRDYWKLGYVYMNIYVPLSPTEDGKKL